jgi:hypothetical protein
MFSSMMNDRLSLKKADGTEVAGLRGSVQGSNIFLMQATPVIESGDEILRHASNGTTERYVVVDPGFKEGLGSIPKHYQMTVKKWQSVEQPASTGSGFHVMINGHNARVNHHTTDNSVNVVHDNSGSAELIAELRQLIDRTDLPMAEREAAREVVGEVEEQFSSGKPKFRIVSALINALPKVVATAEACTKLVALAHGVPPA